MKQVCVCVIQRNSYLKLATITQEKLLCFLTDLTTKDNYYRHFNIVRAQIIQITLMELNLDLVQTQA